MNPLERLSTPLFSDEQLKALGHVLWSHAYLENAVTKFIWFLMKHPKSIGEKITNDLMLGRKIKLLDSLFKEIYKNDKEKIEEFKKLSKRITKANDERNNLVHKFWVLKDTGREIENYTHQQIGSVASLIGEVNNEVLSFRVTL